MTSSCDIPVQNMIPDRRLIGQRLSSNEIQSILMMKFSKAVSAFLMAMALVSLAAFDANAQFPRGGSDRGRGGPPGGGRGPGGGSSPLELLGRDDVRGELGLTEDQQKAISDLQTGLRDSPEFRDIIDRSRAAANDEERRAIFGEMRTVMDKKIDAIIKPEQRSRLTELSLQRQGVRALADPDTAGQFSISSDQQAKIAELNQKYEDERRAIRFNRDMSDEERDAKSEALRVEFEKNASGILSAQQRSVFEQKQGKPFAFADTQGGTPAARPITTQAAPTALTPAALAPSTPETPPEGETATVSFGGEAGENGAPVKELSFNFRYAPWADVLTLFAESAGLTLDLNAVPPGSFNYRDNRKYTPMQALDVLNGYLLQKGYVLVRRDEFLVVVNIDAGIPPNLVPTVTLEELPERGRNELMTVLIPLEGMTAEEAAVEARELLGPQGKVVALNKANKIVVTDIGSNLRRIHGLITGFEVEDGDKVFRKFELEHISVLDADAVVRDLFGLGARGVENVSGSSRSSYDSRSRYGSSSSSSSSRDPRYGSPAPADPNAVVTLAIDERTNSLLVTASPTNIKIIEEAIAAVDLPPLPGAASRSSREPYLEVYQLETADAMEVTKTLNVLFPGTILNEDGRTRRIHIKATEDMHRDIAATIRQLDGIGAGASQMAVIPLGRMDAYTATTSIQSLFYADGDSAPVVQPHPSDNALIVRGTNEQVTQIKLLVTQLEPGEAGGYGGEGNLRTIPLGGRDPEDFLRALERVWNVRGRNPIRTVIPSATGAIRDRRIPSTTSPFSPEEPEAAAPAVKEAERPAPAKPSKEASNDKPNQSASRPPYESPVAARLDASFLKSVPDDLAFAFADESFRDVSFAADPQDDAAADDNPGDTASDEELQRLFLNLNAAEAGQDAATSDSNAPIAITIQGGNLVIVSEDEAALDRLEDVIASLASAMPPKTQWTVFYLRSADATQTASILERLFPTSSVSTSVGASSDGGFMSELSGGLSSMGRGIMGMSGLDSVLSGPQTLRIIPDVRSNSLFVSGPPHQIDEVEDVLRILDASELPEQLRDRAPRYIAVKHAQVEEVAEIIRDVFKEELTPPQPVQQQRGGGGGANPFAALMGGGGGSATAAKVQMTLGIDYQNSRLYVSSSDPTFQQVQAVVEEIDSAALEARRAIRVVPLQHASSTIIRQTIGTLLPRVKVSSSSTSNRASSSGGGNSDSNNDAQQQAAEQMRQQFIQRAFQGGGFPGGGGTPGGGGRPTGGGSTRGGGGFPGGSRTGGGRPGGGR